MSEPGRAGMITPNMISVCIDGTDHGEISGRMYCFYETQDFPFQNEHGLMREMEQFLDVLNYPQSSVSLRSYSPGVRANMQHLREPHSPKPEEVEALLKHSGALATLLVYVKYRQNATWQGTVVHRESGRREDFRSELEFVKIIDHAIGGADARSEAAAAWAD